ncbi:MAG: BON domain-containing protein [Planctomycetota bacterium]|jgi:osmotically-inducible protein OsmY
MRYRIAILLFLAACKGPGYRDPEDSEPLRLEIEDRNIESRVRIALGEDPETAPYDNIRVQCAKGGVTLVGAVDRAAVKRRAGEVALQCVGVRHVRNRITVPGASGRR